MGRVHAVGSVNADVQIRVGGPPETPGLALGDSALVASGGKAANAALMARRLGADVSLYGCVGDDVMAGVALRGPIQGGIDVEPVRTRPGTTGVAMILVPPDGDKGIVLAPGTNESWADDAPVLEREIGAADPGSVLVVDLVIPRALVDVAVAAAHRAQLIVVIDPSPADRLTAELIASADALTPDDREAAEITGIEVASPDDGVQAATELCRRGAGSAYVKLHDGGCVAAWPGGTLHVESPPVDVVDTTGAGDAFAGALAWALLEGWPVADAARAAVAAATCAVGVFGAQPSLPDRGAFDAMSARVRVHELAARART